MKKILFILRHAHRDIIHAADDNGLSEKGRAQAKEIAKYLGAKLKDQKPVLLSSPRLRCQETLEPLAKDLKEEIEISDLLDESSQTKAGPIEKRIPRFKDWWINEAPELVVICSHGDWIPRFFEISLDQPLDLKKAGLAELKLKKEKIQLETLIQSWPV